MPLKAGGLGAAEDPAPLPAAFEGSMAAAMEEALNLLLEGEGRPPAPVDNSTESRDRRMLFVAVAQGIVNHLVANQSAFVITADGDPDNEIPNHEIVIEEE